VKLSTASPPEDYLESEKRKAAQTIGKKAASL
jgi:hypothetical protein